MTRRRHCESINRNIESLLKENLAIRITVKYSFLSNGRHDDEGECVIESSGEEEYFLVALLQFDVVFTFKQHQ